MREIKKGLMFKALKFKRDKDESDRSYRIRCLQSVLDGTMYRYLNTQFHDEKNGAGEYVPLRDRKPSVRSSLCRTVVNDSVSLLFSEGHFPKILCADESTESAMQTFAKDISLNSVMINLASSGSVGSGALLFKVLGRRVFLEVLDTAQVVPKYQPDAPDTLQSVTEQYKTTGSALKQAGYAITDDKSTYWIRRDWTDSEEIHYQPWALTEDADFQPKRDNKRSITHDLGFVPIVWVRNLPGGDEIDGAPTLTHEAIDNQIEIDYQLSQSGRGLKYSSDPMLVLKEPAIGNNGEIIKGAGNALVVNENGGADLLEINGSASSAVLEYVKYIRELAIESMGGNRSSSEKMAAMQSGRAMEMLNQALVMLADRLRISYGEGALREILSMFVLASNKIQLVRKNGQKIGELNADEPITLQWPAWYPQTAQDRQFEASTLKTLADSGHISNATAVKSISAEYDIEDVDAEMTLIASEMAARNQAAKQTVTINE